jgi:hypothetical protein
MERIHCLVEVESCVSRCEGSDEYVAFGIGLVHKLFVYNVDDVFCNRADVMYVVKVVREEQLVQARRAVSELMNST